MIYPGNCYEILTNIRYAINEHSTGLVQGTDVTGSFQNSYLISQINKAQRLIHGILFSQMPELFLTSADLVFASSVASLPWDCGKVSLIQNADGFPLTKINQKQSHVASYTGDRYAYYRYGNTIRVDQDGISETGKLWYYKRCRELTMGMSSAGGALSLTLATTAANIADYYNNMTIEDITDDWADTISDYSSSRVCTLAAQTGAASKYYGLVSDLPEEFHGLIEERAIIQVKQHPKAPFKITKEDISIFTDNLSTVMSSFAGTNTGDVNFDDVFNDFEPY